MDKARVIFCLLGTLLVSALLATPTLLTVATIAKTSNDPPRSWPVVVALKSSVSSMGSAIARLPAVIATISLVNHMATGPPSIGFLICLTIMVAVAINIAVINSTRFTTIGKMLSTLCADQLKDHRQAVGLVLGDCYYSRSN